MTNSTKENAMKKPVRFRLFLLDEKTGNPDAEKNLPIDIDPASIFAVRAFQDHADIYTIYGHTFSVWAKSYQWVLDQWLGFPSQETQ